MLDLSYQFDISTEGVADIGIYASGTRVPADWFFDSLAGPRNDAGVRVNPVSGLRHSPVWTAINVLSGDLAQLDTEVIQERYDGDNVSHRRDRLHKVDFLVNVEPNEWQTPYEWKECMMGWALGWGNGISEIIRERSEPVELRPLAPDVTTYDEPLPGVFRIKTLNEDGNWRFIDPNDTIHIRGLTHDGFWGLSAVRTCQSRIGYGIALQQHGNSVFANGALPGGLIELARPMGPEALEEFRSDWNKLHQGSNRSGAVGILKPGMAWKDRSMSNQDAQWLEATALDRNFVAGLFLIPPYKIGSYENSSVRANLEAQNREYVSYSLARWGHRFEQQIERKLLRRIERKPTPRGRVFLRTNYDEIIQGTRKEKMESAALGVRGRLLTQNEGRQEIGKNPTRGGDEFSNPAIERQPNQDNDDRDDGNDGDDRTALEENLVRTQVAALLKMESSLVSSKQSRKNFDKWAIDFYQRYELEAKRYLAPACNLLRRSWRGAIAKHAEYSYNLIKSGSALDDDWAVEQRDVITTEILGTCYA